MVPTLPGTHLVVGQPRLTFGAFQAFLDAVLRVEHPGELFERRRHPSIRQEVIVFPSAIALLFTEYHQNLPHVRQLALRTRLHQRLNRLDHQRSFLTRTDFDGLPRLLRHGGAPAIDTHQRRLPRTLASGWRRRRLQVTHQRVRRHRQQVALVPLP